MIKANRGKAGTLAIGAADIERVAQYLTEASDKKRIEMVERVEAIEESMRENRHGIESRERNIREGECEKEELMQRMTNLPPLAEITAKAASADLARAISLPYVKSIRAEQTDGKNYIVATTRENALYTTLDHKYSRSERWYKVRPYKIPLPAYYIRIGLLPHKTMATNTDALGIALAEPRKDTAHWLDWIRGYNHEPHPHWGTTSVPRTDEGTGEYRGVCLGEYENEVSKAFRESIADGLIALTIYLQSAGTENAYIKGRHKWALWLGKREYNLALIPSEKEGKKLEEAKDDRYCDCRQDEDNACDNEDCDCSCHD